MFYEFFVSTMEILEKILSRNTMVNSPESELDRKSNSREMFRIYNSEDIQMVTLVLNFVVNLSFAGISCNPVLILQSIIITLYIVSYHVMPFYKDIILHIHFHSHNNNCCHSDDEGK